MEVLKYSVKLYHDEIGRKFPTAHVMFTTPEGEELTITPLVFEKFPESAEEWFDVIKETVDDVWYLYRLNKEKKE